MKTKTQIEPKKPYVKPAIVMEMNLETSAGSCPRPKLDPFGLPDSAPDSICIGENQSH